MLTLEKILGVEDYNNVAERIEIKKDLLS